MHFRTAATLAAIILLVSCLQSPKSPTSSDDGVTTTPDSKIVSTSAQLQSALPNIPTASGVTQFFATSFAIDNDDATQQGLAAQHPPKQIRIDGIDLNSGTGYCFSNESPPATSSTVTCQRPSSDVVGAIAAGVTGSGGRAPTFISAIEMMFKSKKQTTNVASQAGYFFSEAIIEGASIEKTPINFNLENGQLAPVADGDRKVYSYGAGCNLDADPWAVGFKSPNVYLGKEYYLSGLWAFARAKRAAFDETVDNEILHADICHDPHGAGDWYCDLFSDKVRVSYAAIFPALVENLTTQVRSLASRQYPSQVVGSDGVITGAKSAAESTFGIYASSADSNFVTTKGMGKVTNAGGAISGWQNSFVTGLCIRGRRRERNALGTIVEMPLIQALRVELRSPSAKLN